MCLAVCKQLRSSSAAVAAHRWTNKLCSSPAGHTLLSLPLMSAQDICSQCDCHSWSKGNQVKPPSKLSRARIAQRGVQKWFIILPSCDIVSMLALALFQSCWILWILTEPDSSTVALTNMKSGVLLGQQPFSIEGHPTAYKINISLTNFAFRGEGDRFVYSRHRLLAQLWPGRYNLHNTRYHSAIAITKFCITYT